MVARGLDGERERVRLELNAEQEELYFLSSGFRTTRVEVERRQLHALLLLAQVLQRGQHPELQRQHALLPLSKSQREEIWNLTGKSCAWLAIPHPPPSAFVYEEEWPVGIEPVRIGRSVAIVPTGAAEVPEATHLVWLDPKARPGQKVFGTGSHPTTQLLVAALEDRVAPGDRVVDVGTGSGVLALVAARLGAAEVLALDTDPVAIEIAQRNIALNGLEGRVCATRASVGSSPPRSFNLAVVNLPSAVLISLFPDLIQLLRPGGLLLAGGFTRRRVAVLLESARQSQLEVEEERCEGNWLALTFRCASANTHSVLTMHTPLS